ncbi:MAG: hypothetical protein U0Q18_22860 [Bryobacteraceae bacterium]
MAMVATRNFRAVDDLLARPPVPAQEQINKLGKAGARALLRYESSELNRWYFETWGMAETAIGVVLMMVLLFGSSETKFTLLLALLMLLSALVQRFGLTPEIVALGRIIDFLPQPSPERTRFGMLHGVYVGLELFKWVVGWLLTLKLLFRRRKTVRQGLA